MKNEIMSADKWLKEIRLKRTTDWGVSEYCAAYAAYVLSSRAVDVKAVIEAEGLKIFPVIMEYSRICEMEIDTNYYPRKRFIDAALFGASLSGKSDAVDWEDFDRWLSKCGYTFNYDYQQWQNDEDPREVKSTGEMIEMYSRKLN